MFISGRFPRLTSVFARRKKQAQESKRLHDVTQVLETKRQEAMDVMLETLLGWIYRKPG